VTWPARLATVILRWRLAALLAIHILCFTATYLLAFLIRFDGEFSVLQWEMALQTLPVVVGVKVLASLIMGSHRGWWRYATFPDLVNIAEAATLGSVAIAAFGFFTRTGQAIPRSVILLDWAGMVLLLGGLHAGTRLFREHFYPMIMTRPPKRVLVVGASEAGVALIHELRGQSRSAFKVVGILDPDRSLKGRVLAGVEVLGTLEDVRRHAVLHRAKAVLVPTPSTAARQVRQLVSACSEVGVKVQVVPGLNSLLEGAFNIAPRDVDIQDLLCREPVQIDCRSIVGLLRGRVVLVTGAAGSIGSEICRQALAFRPRRLILLDHSENGLFFLERELGALAPTLEVIPSIASITDGPRLRDVFARYRPSAVFHAAAHKHVPMMEKHPGEAIKNNVFGTRTLVDEAIRAGVDVFVMISTDKAVNPTSVMGASKRLAEMYVQANSMRSSTRLITVRFGNVLGSNGSVVPVFKEQIRTGGPVTVTHPEITRYFMTIPEAAQLVLQAGVLGAGGEIFVLDMGEPVKVVDLARDLIRLSGLTEEEVKITFTGLRPGEKLFEELYDAGEVRLPTPHPRIFMAQHRPCPLNPLRALLRRLAALIDGPADEVVDTLRVILPEYAPGSAASTPDAFPARGGAFGDGGGPSHVPEAYSSGRELVPGLSSP